MDSPAESMEDAVKKHELVPQLQFPPGYRFVPTEEELVDVYLRRKIEGQKLPLDVVNEVTILEWQPGKLVETYKAYGENKWYFFTEREPSSSKKEKEPNRKVRVPGVKATWKATGSLTGICRKGKDGKPLDMVGTKRVLIYHSSDAEEDGKWSMHEYVLTSNSQIGQYALCSIQRKQHSDTEHKTGEASGTSKRKRETTTMEPSKTTKRKKAISAKTEAAQKKKQEMASQHAPPEAPLTPPKHDKQRPQQESPLPPYAPPTSLPGVPLQQGYPSSSDGYLQIGASAPMSAEYAQAFSYDQMCGDIAGLQFAMQNNLTFCDQGEQSQSLTWSQSMSSDGSVDDAPFQAYQQQENYGLFAVPDQLVYTERYMRQNVDLFSGTQSNSNWGIGQDQLIYQPGDEGAIGGVQDTYASQDFLSYEQQGLSAVVFGQETRYGSLDQLTKSFQGVAVASKGDDDNMASFSADAFLRDVDLYFRNALSVDVPQHKVACAQEGSNQALQNQDELQMLCGQQQQTSSNGPACNGASSGCAVRS